VQAEVQSLLQLQEDDAAVDALEKQLDALNARTGAMKKEREAVEAAIAKLKESIAAEEKTQRTIQGRLAEHKQTQAHNTAQLDVVTKPKEAAAAMAQIEHAKRAIAETETDLKNVDSRLRELRDKTTEREMALEELTSIQASETATLETQRADLVRDLAAATAARSVTAGKAPKNLVANYDRVRGRKKARVLYALNGSSCGNCDTAMPTQGRAAMASKGGIAVCEGCGVMLYAESN
jgi:predicted  nucleic acid-binding Zn-ribbon protein